MKASSPNGNLRGSLRETRADADNARSRRTEAESTAQRVTRTLMSAMGQKQTFAQGWLDVRLVPQADIGLQFRSNLLSRKNVVTEATTSLEYCSGSA